MELKDPIWKEIQQGPYEVSDQNQIRRFEVIDKDTGIVKCYKPLKMYQNGNDTISVNIVNYNHKVQKLQFARLVAEAFNIPNPMGYRYVGYKDGNRNNCSPENLEWTQHRNLNVTSRKGTVIKCVEDGRIHPSKYMLAKKLGVSITRVRQCITEGRPLKGCTFVVCEDVEKGEYNWSAISLVEV